MKTFITALLLSIFSLSYSQDYKVNIATGTYGINPKIRLQIELPLKGLFPMELWEVII